MANIIRNCINCENCGYADDGGDPPSNSYRICKIKENLEEDKNFLYKTEQSCHVPGFWQYLEEDEELKKSFDEEIQSFDKTYELFKKKYLETLKNDTHSPV